jgi:serine/threonine protein kinase
MEIIEVQRARVPTNANSMMNSSSSTSNSGSSTTAEYLVGQVIGEGSFGRVLYGRHKTTGRDVAMKVVDKLTCRKHPHTVAKAVVQEQRLLRLLHDCRYVVTLLASFHDEECLYLVMECCKGGNLDHVIQSIHQQVSSSSLSSPKQHPETLIISRACAHYGRQILEGLDCLHQRGIIHADLKPSNILISFSSSSRGGGAMIQLADFGSAIVLASSSSSFSSSSSSNTNCPGNASSCLIATTTDYAAPEIIMRRSKLSASLSLSQQHHEEETCYSYPTTAIDLWSLGCILYEFWCGKSPFHAASDFLAMERILEYTSIMMMHHNSSDDHQRAAQTKWLFSAANPNDTKLGSSAANESVQCAIPVSSISEPWRDLICGLLQVEPEFRHCCRPAIRTTEAGGEGSKTLKMLNGEVVQQQCGNDVVDRSYDMLRSHPAWNDVDLSTEPCFVPSQAPEWLSSQPCSWRDGSLGWSAFLV